MPRTFEKHTYVVCRKGEKTPIIVGGTHEECASAMGVTLSTFNAILVRCRDGASSKWEIYESLLTTTETFNRPSAYKKHSRIANMDLDIIKELHKDVNAKSSLLSCKFYTVEANINYRIRKIRTLTGLDPRNEKDIQRLYQMYVEGQK